MATIHIDGRSYEVPMGGNLLEACLSLGIDLPYFCWHPALGSVGACRQCAVKQFRDEQDTRGRIVMACMTPVEDGMRISVEDPEAKAFRRSVAELLMVSHPHDCPVCDEGGECHLQDMTVMTGHSRRDYRFNKRTHRNQDLGPLVLHEMNRCIACYRCVRFYRDYAGGRDFDVLGAHDHVYFGRDADGALENEFSGNLVEICPTGVFTDRTFRDHYTRAWDLQTAPSVCVHCGIGCNTIPGERYGTLRRVRNRYHHEVNGYFLCDRGRYGYEFVNGPSRIREPVVRSAGGRDPEAYAAALLGENAKIIGIGSPRASVEANFALRSLVGPGNFFLGVSESDSLTISAVVDVLRSGPARAPSLLEVEECDAVLVLGEDVTQVAPRLALSLRQSVRNRPRRLADDLKIPRWNAAAVADVIQDRRGPLFIAAPYPTRMDDLAAATLRAAPEDLARLGFAVAHALDDHAPAVEDLPGDVHSLSEEIAGALREAARPLIVSGTTCGSEALIRAAANVARALSGKEGNADLCLIAPECNSLGLGLMGGGNLADACRAVEEGRADTVIILENDLYRRAEARSVDALFEKAAHVIALDSIATRTTARAEVVLPAASFAESDGTLVSSEGRAQRYFKVFPPAGAIRESWRWLRDLGVRAGRAQAGSARGFEDLTKAAAADIRDFGPIADAAPEAGFRVLGRKIPRQSHRSSGRTAIHASIDVHEPRPPEDPESPLAFSMEGWGGLPPPALIPRYWAPGWNSVQSLNKFQQEVGGPLRGGDPGKRLMEPGESARAEYFGGIPAAFTPAAGEWRVVPIPHLFGSEELSALSPAVRKRSTGLYLALCPAEMERLGWAEGREVEIALGGATWRLRVRAVPGLPEGLAGIPAGVPESPGPVFPASVKLGDAS